MSTIPNSANFGETMRGGWWALAGGAVTGLIIGAIQRRYPGASFAALVGVGILCGALFNLLMWAVGKRSNR